MAVLLATFERHRVRLQELRSRLLVGQFAGAAGTLASLGKEGLRIQEALMVDLGLGQPEIAWHTMRDRFAEAGCFLGLLTGTLGKIAMDINLMAQTEVQEVSESFTPAAAPAAPCRRSGTLFPPATFSPAQAWFASRWRAAGRDGGGARTLERAMGDRMDRQFRRFSCLASGALAHAPVAASPVCRLTRNGCARIST